MRRTRTAALHQPPASAAPPFAAGAAAYCARAGWLIRPAFTSLRSVRLIWTTKLWLIGRPSDAASAAAISRGDRGAAPSARSATIRSASVGCPLRRARRPPPAREAAGLGAFAARGLPEAARPAAAPMAESPAMRASTEASSARSAFARASSFGNSD
jgi:hypothetical protein